jgi:2'-5' RNA ligase
MTNRAIVIFPKFDNIQLINEIREKYDPLHHYIAPHITLVFPFGSDITTSELIEHIKCQLAGIGKFDLVMKGVTGAIDGYVFLDVKIGNDKIIEMHDKLYQGLLKKYHNRFIPYIPHLTIGRLFDADLHQAAVQSLFEFDVEFRTAIEEICVEVIDDQDQSIIEYIHRL